MTKPMKTRREFCGDACRVASLAALAAAAQACGGSGSSPTGPSASALSVLPASVTSGAITLPIDSASPLASVGGAALLQTNGGVFLVAHTGQDTFSALSATCTHEICTITGFGGGNFVCPCHGSRFATNGSVVAGPASRSLQSFATQFTNGVLTIRL